MRLGKTVADIRRKGYLVRDDPGRRRWLEAQGFEFDLGERQWQAVLRALRRYKELKGQMSEFMAMTTAMKATRDAEIRQRDREIAELRAGGVARSEVSAREEPETPVEPPVLRAPPVPAAPRGEPLAAERPAGARDRRDFERGIDSLPEILPWSDIVENLQGDVHELEAQDR